VEPLTEPPEEEEGDDTIAGGGTPKMLELEESEFADAPELDEDDAPDDEDDPSGVADV